MSTLLQLIKVCPPDHFTKQLNDKWNIAEIPEYILLAEKLVHTVVCRASATTQENLVGPEKIKGMMVDRRSALIPAPLFFSPKAS